jgi:phosphohistidine phosphatase SixA
VASSAVRTRETAKLLIEAAGWRIRVRERKAFYASTIERSLDVLRAIEGPSVVLAVGHEPTWSALAALLAGGGRVHLPTAGLVWIELETDVWSEVAAGSGVLRALVTPALARALDPASSPAD